MKQIVAGLATRGQDSWLTSTHGLPDGKQALSMGKTWKQAQDLLQQAAEMALKAPPGSVAVDLKLEDPKFQKLVDEVRRRQAALRDAKFHYDAAMGTAVRTLAKQMTVRDVAQMLGCSHQHVSKLARKSAP
jgi:predicted XRE-type DNA-binding protein